MADTAEQDVVELFGQFGKVVSAHEVIETIDTTTFQGRYLTVKVAGGRWLNARL